MLLGLGLKLYFPPNNCIPRSAKMTMKRKRRSSRDTMDRMLFKREATSLRKAVQYLREVWEDEGRCGKV